MRYRRLPMRALALAAAGALAVSVGANLHLYRRAERSRQQVLDTYVETGQQLLLTPGHELEAALWLHRAYAQGSRSGVLRHLLAESLRSADAQLEVFVGHAGIVTSAVLSADGQTLLTASADGSARLWSVASGQILRELKGHTAPVNGAALSADGRLVATASEDGTARLWEAASGKVLAELRASGHRAASAAFSADGTQLITADGGGAAHIWDVKSALLLRTLTGHRSGVSSAAFSPDGRSVVTASYDRTARIWDAASGTQRSELVAHEGLLHHAVFSPDGTLVATAGDDKTALVWEVATGKVVADLWRHNAAVRSVGFSPDGRSVVTASDDGRWQIWDVATEALLASYHGQASALRSAAFSADGRQILTAGDDWTARLWRASPAARKLDADIPRVVSASFSPDGKLAVTTRRDGAAHLWDVGSGRMLHELRTQPGTWQEALKAPRSGAHLDYDRPARSQVEIMRRALDDRRNTPALRSLNNAEFSPDGRLVITAGDGGTVVLWEARSGRLLHRLQGDMGPISMSSATFSPDSRQVTSVGSHPSSPILLWDVATGQLLRHLTGTPFTNRCRFSPDGRFLLSASSEDQSALLWDAQSGKRLRELRLRPGIDRRNQRSPLTHPEQYGLLRGEESPGSGIPLPELDQPTRWLHEYFATDLPLRVSRKPYILEEPPARLMDRQITPDGRFLFIGLELWEVRTGRLARRMAAFDEEVADTALSPDGRSVITAGWDGSVQLWELTEENRSPEQIGKLLRCRTGLRLVGDLALPARPEPAACRQPSG